MLKIYLKFIFLAIRGRRDKQYVSCIQVLEKHGRKMGTFPIARGCCSKRS